MFINDEEKRRIMSELAQGNVEFLEENPAQLSRSEQKFAPQDYQNFDDFAQRSSRAERHQLFSQAFHPNLIAVRELEPELQRVLTQIKPTERNDVARSFLDKFKPKGLSEHDLEQQLVLSTHNPERMSADDLSKLVGFAYHNHPEIFQSVLGD
ncbi:MAG TPA: hypothetical protein V6D03_06195 [Candidatus Caenarcaniphilales bacterium]